MRFKLLKGMGLMDMMPFAIIIVILGFVFSIGSTILTDLTADQAADSFAHNATDYAQESLAEGSTWIPTIAQVVVAAIIIGILMSALYVGSMRGD